MHGMHDTAPRKLPYATTNFDRRPEAAITTAQQYQMDSPVVFISISTVLDAVT